MVVVGLLMYYLAFVSAASQISMFNRSIRSITFPSINGVMPDRAEPGALVTEERRINELFNRRFPDTPSVPQSLSRLIHAATDIGATDISFKIGERVSAGFVPIGGRELYQWPITLRLRSDYYQLARLLREIAGSERQIDIVRIEMSRATQMIVTRLDLMLYSLSDATIVERGEDASK